MAAFQGLILVAAFWHFSVISVEAYTDYYGNQNQNIQEQESDSYSDDSDDSSFPVWLIFLIIFGVLLKFFLIGLRIYCCYRRRQRRVILVSQRQQSRVTNWTITRRYEPMPNDYSQGFGDTTPARYPQIQGPGIATVHQPNRLSIKA